MNKGDKKAEKVLAQLQKFPEPYGVLGERVHHLILDNAPELQPTWRWGLAFYTRDGKDICYLKKEETCMVFGFGEDASLAPDTETPQLVPCAWNFVDLDDAAEERLAGMVRRAVGRNEEP